MNMVPAEQTEKQTAEDETRIGRPTVNRVGYRRETKAGGWEFLIFPEVWKSEICKGLDSLRVAEALHAAHFLDRGDGKNWAKKHRIPRQGPTRFYTVAGGILQGDEK